MVIDSEAEPFESVVAVASVGPESRLNITTSFALNPAAPTVAAPFGTAVAGAVAQGTTEYAAVTGADEDVAVITSPGYGSGGTTMFWLMLPTESAVVMVWPCPGKRTHTGSPGTK